jgi:phospholipase C
MRRPIMCAAAFGLIVAAFPQALHSEQLSDIDHIIIIYLENHSFDNLFGLFPGADGLAAAGASKIQVDKSGKPYDFLPRVIDTDGNSFPSRPHVDTRFLANLPNQPFNIEAYVPIGEKTGDAVHRFYEEQLQINGGRMNKFAAYSDAGGLVMGFYDASQTWLWRYAREFALADHFFHAAFGGSRNPFRNPKRERTWRSSNRRSKTPSRFSSRKPAHISSSRESGDPLDMGPQHKRVYARL